MLCSHWDRWPKRLTLAVEALVNAEQLTQNAEETGSFLGGVAEAGVVGCEGVGERRTVKRRVRFWEGWPKRESLAA